MKRVSIVLMGLCFVVCCTASAHAWFGSKKKETPAPAVPTAQEQKDVQGKPAEQAQTATTAPKADKAIEKELSDRRDAVAKKMTQLNNTEWQIEMTPLSGKGKKELEIVTFKNNQVSFANFSKKGFPMTNITLTIQNDGSVIWETMQTSEKAGICFWRGEMDKTMANMRGVLSHKVDDKTKDDYSFASSSRKALQADK